MDNEKIEAMIRHLEQYDTGGRTGVFGELVTDCENCGLYDESCAGCRIRSGEEVRAMITALKKLVALNTAPDDGPEPSDGMGPEIDDENGMSEAELNRED